jgi:hypothetical protein
MAGLFVASAVFAGLAAGLGAPPISITLPITVIQFEPRTLTMRSGDASRIDAFGRQAAEADANDDRTETLICAQGEDGSAHASRLANRRARLIRGELSRRGVNPVRIVDPQRCGNGWAGRPVVQVFMVPR